jgi:tetratricopeptide (TPR) repeat protein
MSDTNQRAWILGEQFNFAAAEGLLRQSLAVNPNEQWAHAYLAYCLTELRRWNEAIKQARVAVQVGPTHAYAFFTLARTLVLYCRYAQAMAPAMEVLRLDSHDARNHWPLSGLLYELGLPRQALEVADRGLRINGQQIDCLRARAFALCGLVRFADARECMAQAFTVRADDVYNHNYLGWIELKAGSYGAAAIAFKDALLLDPMLAQAHLGLAHTHARLADISKAIEHFREAHRLNPKFTGSTRIAGVLRKWIAAESELALADDSIKHGRVRRIRSGAQSGSRNEGK